MNKYIQSIGLGLLLVVSRGIGFSQSDVPFINTWLVLGTFENSVTNDGYDRDWIDEANLQPKEGMISAGKTWRYFDDRLFSRNYDCYNDVYSYYKIKRHESITAKVVYAHTYVYSNGAKKAQVKMGADRDFKVWLNGELIKKSTVSNARRNTVVESVQLKDGWNRVLFKIANQEQEALGFYFNLSDEKGKWIPNLVCSTQGDDKNFNIVTQAMDDIKTPAVPDAYREWPYVGMDSTNHLKGPELADLASLWEMNGGGENNVVQCPSFVFMAQGGIPPYRWSLSAGKLPTGLQLNQDGQLVGKPEVGAALGKYSFTVLVEDESKKKQTKEFTLNLKERPNRWLETSRLTALIHAPDLLADQHIPKMAKLMKRQGYVIGMPIAYGNGIYDDIPRWPSVLQPKNPKVSCLINYKKALEAEGVKFGIYLGEITLAKNNGERGTVALIDEAIEQTRPMAVWFDHSTKYYTNSDAFYSIIRTYNPETVVIKSSFPYIGGADWDVISLEGWTCWGDKMFYNWPKQFDWPKKFTMESWRYIPSPNFAPSIGVVPDWKEYLKVQISLICENFVANIDHSPTTGAEPGELVDGKLVDVSKSVLWQCHEKMADWANPPGMPPLLESYLQVVKGPLPECSWGYHTISLDRKRIYLHVMSNNTKNIRVGLNGATSISLDAFKQKIRSVTLMNKNKEIPFAQKGEQLTIPIDRSMVDEVDTILKIQLSDAYPNFVDTRKFPFKKKSIPEGNLAFEKSAKFLDADGIKGLPGCLGSDPTDGLDGKKETVAQAGSSYAWTYQVDLENSLSVSKIVITFNSVCYATEYNVECSENGKEWKRVAHVGEGEGSGGGKAIVHEFEGTQARFVRVQAIKPNAPGQEGAQMGISELEVY